MNHTLHTAIVTLVVLVFASYHTYLNGDLSLDAFLAFSVFVLTTLASIPVTKELAAND